MGITRLTSHLEPFQKDTVLGCTNHACSSYHQAVTNGTSVVIDGPGLAYYLYYKLLGRNGATSAIQAQPSYQQLGQAVLSCLDFFEECGTTIEHVFFDGALPDSKRATRLERLSSTLVKLNAYKSVHASGFKVSKIKSIDVKAPQLLYPWSPPLFTKNLPASPFLVPAAFEALKASKYSDVTRLVPGEADAFLATATKSTTNGICLTGDSDLAIHDLGGGSLAFFTSLQAQSCSTCNQGFALMAKALRQPEFIASLGETATRADLLDLGFEIQQDPSNSFEEALRRLRAKSSHAHKARSSGWSETLNSFVNEYSQPDDLSALTRVPSWCRMLDNRTSELAMQAMSADPGPFYSYLLPLIEDPTRASAWVPSRNIRALAYTVLLARTGSRASEILEFCRSGQRIIPVDVARLPDSEVTECLTTVREELQIIQQSEETLSFVHIWHVYASICVYRSYLEDGRAPPSLELMRSALGNSHLAWPVIHLRAQIQGTLWSMRILSQLLLIPTRNEDETNAFSDKVLPIRTIILTSVELANENVAQHARLIVQLANAVREPAEEPISEQNETGESDTSMIYSSADSGAWQAVRTTGKKSKRKVMDEKSTAHGRPKQSKDSRNPFDLLR